MVRTWAERWINNYNPELSPIWGANTDIQLCNNEQIADYISKHVTKGEPHLMSKLLSEAMADLKAGKKFDTTLFKVTNAILNQREVGATEAAYRLGGFNMVFNSDGVYYINARMPKDRYRLLDINEQDSSKNKIMKNIFDRYEKRPSELKDMCLYEFASKYKVVYPGKKKEDVIEEDEEVNEQDNDEDTKPMKLN